MSETELPRSVLIFAPSVDGGIPHYTHHQAEELARRGVDVTVLCPPDHPWGAGKVAYRQERRLSREPRGTSVLAKAAKVIRHVWIHYQLLWWIGRLRPSAVVFEANTEFCAALWAWPHLLLAAFGLPYVMTLHDPVRGRWFGPDWFDRLSLWAAYRMLRGGLVHGDPPPGAYLPQHMCVESVPHGLFGHLAKGPPAFDLRDRLGIARAAFVLLSFGHIADRKNQHLLVEAVAALPELVLVIAGPVMSSRNRPPQFYRDLAERLGCTDRVHVIDRFVPDEEVGAWFAGADAVALTYDSGFISQSGVLQVAAQWDKPVLASGGEGVLRETVEGFGLGVFVKPDDAGAIVEGLRALIAAPGGREAGFAALREAASWEKNVDGLLRLLAGRTARRP